MFSYNGFKFRHGFKIQYWKLCHAKKHVPGKNMFSVILRIEILLVKTLFFMKKIEILQ